MDVDLLDDFWAPRREQLREHTLAVMLARLDAQGAVDNFRRLAHADGAASSLPRRAMHFSDSDVYKWVEAALLADRADLAAPIVELVAAVQQPDGYLHTYYGTDGAPGRYADLDFGHEHYCFGHLIEAAIAHHETTGSEQLLDVATRLADHVCDTFGPGRDERTDAHPEIELALARLARVRGEERYLRQAAWTVERRLAQAGTTLDDLRLGGHAVRALYLASGIAEIARATGDARWTAAALRSFASMIDEHAYPTGAVGGRWLGEAVGKPYELPDALSYTESCAAVAAVHLSQRIWRLAGDPRSLDQIELLLFNAVPCGVGAGGDTWFYSQPHAVDEVAADVNPWIYGFDYGQLMMHEWFPARRHEWFDVPCCPPNLGRMFAAVDRYVAEVSPAGDLLVHLPVAARIRGAGFDVEIASRYPDGGDVGVRVHAAPAGSSVRVRTPGWAGGSGHDPLPADGRLSFPVEGRWWETDGRVEGAGASVYLRRGPVVQCVEGLDVADITLADLRVDPSQPPDGAFAVARRDGRPLHRPVGAHRADEPRRLRVPTVAYADWANRGATTMRYRFRVR